MFNPFNTPTSLRVVGLQLQETGTYNPQYRRPYVTQVNGWTLNAIVETAVSSQQTKLDSTAIGNCAAELLIPSAVPEAEAFMPNGWTTPRMRFSLVLECDYSVGGKVKIYIQGYTEYSDLSYSGNFDSNMRFFINSITTTTFMNVPTSYGVAQQETVRDCSHLLVNQQASNLIDINQNTAYSMRPQDVFGTMQHSFVNDASAFAGNDLMVDTRCVLRGAPSKSNRVNTMSSTYMADMINGFSSSLQGSNFENTEADVLGRARNTVCEDSPMKDPFLNAMMGIMGNNQISNTFTYNDLMRLDPNTNALTFVVRPNHDQIAGIHQFGQTAHWGGSDRITHAATFISNAVPALMSFYGLSKLTFTATNAGSQTSIIIVAIASIAGTGNTQAIYGHLENRISKEICNVISFNGQAFFDVAVSCDIMQDTVIDIAVEGAPSTRFVAPTFTDSSFCPVVTNNMTRTTDVARDLNSVMDNIREGIIQNTSHYQVY